MNRILIAAAAASALLLSACGPTPQEQCATAKNPAECLQVAQAGGDVNDYLLYGMAGYMLSSAINGAGQRQPVIVQDPKYYGTRRAIPSYQASRDYVRKSTSTTVTTKRSIFGGTKTTTTTTSVRSSPSRSSWGSSSYRSSSSSFRSSSFRSGGFRR
jgi:hypothetical protein